MTDVSKLDDLAAEIAPDDLPDISAYAVAQAAATQSQEAAITELRVRVAALEAAPTPVPPDPEPEPPTPTPGQGVKSPTYEFSIHSSFTQGQDRNEYNAQWAAETNGTYTYDRLADDRFAGAALVSFDRDFPIGPNAGRFPPVDNDLTSWQGFWGRWFNAHNAKGEGSNDQGWTGPGPGNSSFAIDFIDGNLQVNLDANGANGAKNFLAKKLLTLGEVHSVGWRGVMGRTDGTTARPGALEVAIDGAVVLTIPRCNTVWRWPDGTAQRRWWCWTGFYTEGIFDGRQCGLRFCYPWLGPTIPDALKVRPAASAGTWNPNVIPITNTTPYSSSNRSGRHPGNAAPRDHSNGPGTCKMITPEWDTSMLLLPPAWLVA